MASAVFTWLIVALFFLFLEMGSPGLLYCLSFACGAVVSALISYYNEAFIVQGVGFLVGTVIALVLLKRMVRHEHKHSEKTNVERLLGKQAIVIKEISALRPGQVKVDGQLWSARSINGQLLPVDAVVTIVAIKGVHVMVSVVQHT